MSHLTKFQKNVLDAVYAICAETGRAATIKEVAIHLNLGITTVWKHTEALRAQGLLLRGRGLQPGNGRYGEGWKKGVAYAASEAERVLVENHAEPQLVKAVHEAMVDAQSAGGGE
jgi:predicted ArsR family transcriptional regulator